MSGVYLNHIHSSFYTPPGCLRKVLDQLLDLAEREFFWRPVLASTIFLTPGHAASRTRHVIWPATMLFIRPQAQHGWLLRRSHIRWRCRAFPPRMSELHPNLATLCMNEFTDLPQRWDLIIASHARAIRTDPAIGRYPTCFYKDKRCTLQCIMAQRRQMIRGQTALRLFLRGIERRRGRVLAHRSNYDPILQSTRPNLDWLEQCWCLRRRRHRRAWRRIMSRREYGTCGEAWAAILRVLKCSPDSSLQCSQIKIKLGGVVLRSRSTSPTK